MCDDVSFSSVDEFNEFYHSPLPPLISPDGGLREAIYCTPSGHFRFVQSVNIEKGESEIKQRIQKISNNNRIAPMGKVSGEVGVTYEWGGNGGGVSGYVSGSASDDKGNKAEIEVEVNNDGSGSVNVSASHDKTTNDQ